MYYSSLSDPIRCLMYCRRRLEKRIYIPLPNFESRKELIRINLKTVEASHGFFITALAMYRILTLIIFAV